MGLSYNFNTHEIDYFVHTLILKFFNNTSSDFLVMSNIIENTEAYMVDVWTRAHDLHGIEHHRVCVKWVKFLRPDADEALVVAGLLHDIERAIHGDWKVGSIDENELRKHQDLCAQAAEEFLKTQDVDRDFVDRVIHLVSFHEVGGDDDQNVLCDADCITFFEMSALRYAQNFEKKGKTKDEVIELLDYKFNLIHSEQARDAASGWYEQSKALLN